MSAGSELSIPAEQYRKLLYFGLDSSLFPSYVEPASKKIGAVKMRLLPKATRVGYQIYPRVRYEMSIEKFDKSSGAVTVNLSRSRPELKSSLLGVKMSKPTPEINKPIFGTSSAKTRTHSPLADEMAREIKIGMRAPNLARASIYGLCSGVNYACKIAIFTLPVAAALLPVSPLILLATAAMCVFLGIMAGVQAALYHRALENADFNQDRTVINMLRGFDIYRTGKSVIREEKETPRYPGKTVDLLEFVGSSASPVSFLHLVFRLVTSDGNQSQDLKIKIF